MIGGIWVTHRRIQKSGLCAHKNINFLLNLSSNTENIHIQTTESALAHVKRKSPNRFSTRVNITRFI